MRISIIIPVYNEEELIDGCLNALIYQDYPKKDYEIIVVDDGSTDRTLKVIKKKRKEAEQENVKIRIISFKKNKGWLIARETGAKKAKYKKLLFIDSRCIADKNVLKNLKKIEYEPVIGNPLIDIKRSIFDRFGYLIRRKIYPYYFGENFEPVYVTKHNFDKIPKGTTVFFCDKKLFLSSQLEDKSKYVSEDIKLLWYMVQKKKILKHPDVKVSYLSRTSIKSEIKHMFERGPRFVDYYLDFQKKRFWLFIFFPILSLIFTIILFFFNLTYFLYWLGFLISLWIAVSIWVAENIKDFFIVIIFLPIIGFSFETGILKGIILKIINNILK